MIATDQLGNEVEVSLCTLCDNCGFSNDCQQGILKKELGLNEIVEKQILFTCHKHLVAFNGSENQGSEDLVSETGKLKVCTGYVQSLIVSGVKPKTRIMGALMSMIPEVDPKIMTLDEMREYHKIGK